MANSYSVVEVPVTLRTGEIAYLPVAEDETETYLIVVKPDKAYLLTTSDPNEDRIAVGALTLAEALGKVLRDNPKLCYDDILDHMVC
jgi:hypothetical protein